ncbi:nucleoporin [Agrocybe pediades]|nr:nucleoporin [Agrocybe pediades]
MASAFTQSRPFAASSSNQPTDSTSRQAPTSKPVSVDLPALQNASRILLEQFTKDAQIIPDLGETLTASGSQVSSSYSIFPDDIRVPFQKRKFVGIPDGLFQYYDSVNVTSHMGLLVEIERVWISIDHKLFLWDYNDGQEIASFMDQPDVITHVALVKPKQGLFIDEITSLLVICTPVTVLLIGVAHENKVGMDGRTKKDIKLYATDLSIATEIEMASVVGTADGRIFMCGQQDGNLYEFHYQAKESWFGKRVQLVNHSVGGVQSLLPRFAASGTDERIVDIVSDHKRNCFYTLTSRNTISMYTPSGDKTIQHVQTLSSLYKAAQEKAPGSPALTPQTFQIINIHVIDPSQSREGVQLMAITTNGVRLFFAPSLSYGYSFNSSSATSSLRPLAMIHVRLPPLNLIHPDEQAKVYRPTSSSYGAPSIHSQPTSRPYICTSLDGSCYADGLTVASQPGDVDGTDYTLCLAPDLTRIGNIGQLNLPPQQPQQSPFNTSYNQYNNTGATNRPPLTEYATLITIPGRTWAMAAIEKKPVEVPAGTPAPTVINELASEFSEFPNQFMLLTNVGLTFLMKRRAVDYLKAVLEELQSEGNVQPIIEFRDSFGRDQTCSMLLGLASGNTFLDPFDASRSGTISSVSPEIAAVAKQAFYDFGERPIWTERVMYGTAENKGVTMFSGRREGFALYFARLVRPFWKAKLTVLSPLGTQVLNASETTLINVQKNLYALKEFLARNPHLFHSSPSEPTSTRSLVTEQEAWKAEQSSVSELQSLLARTIEALSFVLLLNDYQLGDLISKCEPDVQKLILEQTFEDLITSQHGMTISRALVNVVIDQQIGQQISVDTISEVLQHRCGSFCSTDDVMLYKAKENIRKAAETRNPAERQKYLAESLRLFTKGAKILEFEKLREVIGDFQQLDYAKGVVNLPLTCAQVQDIDNGGLEYWRTGLTTKEPRQELAVHRQQCYELILDSLTVFEDKCSKTQPAGVPALDDPETVRTHAYELAFASEDEMFHSVLYDWLIGRNLADDLLEMRPPFLEAHLKREPATVQKFQLLWQFYVKNGQPLRAAEVLGALAESTQFDLHLEARLEYLTLAVANAKSHPISAGGRHETAIAFLTDLEERLDVAQVQLEVYNTLLPHVDDDPTVGERINLLSKQLFTLNDLYQKFAVPFDLPAIKLLCLHVSGHSDDTVSRAIWSQIYSEILQETENPNDQADLILQRFVPLGQRFYPSECAFPLRHITTLLVQFLLENRQILPAGWAARVLVQCGVRFSEIWDLLNEMYESHVPPFNEQSNVQITSSEIAVLITDWLQEATRPQASVLRAEFPAGRVDAAIDQYLAELQPNRVETKTLYENAKRLLRKYW